MPTAIYTLLSSWMLVPLLVATPLWQLIPIGIFAILIIVLFIRAVYMLQFTSTPERYILWVCLLTLLANGLSGWWWQTGNIKFYLFMQINIICVGGLYVSKLLNTHPARRRRELLLSLSVVFLLVFFHITLTLPYETKGGVFEVAYHLTDDKAIVTFQDPKQARILPYISANRSETLADDFCEVRSRDVNRLIWWVVRQDTVSNCGLLTSALEISRFQVDRTRLNWVLFDMTSVLQTK